MKRTPRDYVLVVRQGELRMIVGLLTNVRGSAEAIRRRACERLELAPDGVELIPAPRPAPDGAEIARLLRQYKTYMRLEDIDEEDDLSAFLQIYSRLRAADVELPPDEVAAIDKFIQSTLAEELVDEGGPGDTDGDYGKLPPAALRMSEVPILATLPPPGPRVRARVG
ncbi:MAG TPA: hypothetical protein VHQ47_07540 [Phycisphaerae bacterium]|nr:hypothetical protein [Phycisphaerae bacterium]